jgi:hypothetical protein
MNRKYFFLLLVYQLVICSSASDVENSRLSQRAKSEQNWVQLSLVEMCESRIPPLMSGVVLGVFGLLSGDLINALNKTDGCLFTPLGKRCGLVGFGSGYVSVAICQCLVLYKFGIK